MNQKTDMQALCERLRLLLSGDPLLAKTEIARATIDQAIGALASRPDAQADERGALMCERLRAMGLNTANEAADLIEQMGRAAAPQPSAPECQSCGDQITPHDPGICGNCFAMKYRAPQAEAPQGVAEGYALVPIELTPEMVKAGSTSGGLGMDFHEWMGRIKHAWRHMLAAAPSPDREQVREAAECCDTPSLCSSVRRCTKKDASPCREQMGERWCFKCGHNAHEGSCADASPSSECGERPVENAGVRNKIAAALHYPDHWDTAAYPTLDDAAWEAIAAAKLTCSECGDGQACPHGVDDGACKQCYGEATSGERQGLSDEQILALNVGEVFFSETPSKYPEAGHGTQYHAGAPGVVKFARAAIALAASTPTLGAVEVSDDDILEDAKEAFGRSREYSNCFGEPSERSLLHFVRKYMNRASSQPQAAKPKGLTEERVTALIKEWFPDRSYQAPFFARALLTNGE